MNKMIMLCAFLYGVFLPCVHGQSVSKVGTTAAGFLNIEVGSRAIGMGGAYTTIVADPTAVFWNPAGLVRSPQTSTVFHHTSWLDEIQFNFAALAVPISGFGTIGLGATFLTMDDMERTTLDQPDGTGEMFGAGSYALSASYARSLTDRFSIGGSFKYIHEYIYHSSASGIAFDIGTHYVSQFNGLMIGMSITNYGTKMQMSGRDMLIQSDISPLVYGNNENINANLQTDAFDMPLMFRVGIAMDLLQGRGDNNLLMALDAMHPNDDVENLNLGVEYGYKQTVFLRAGYKSLFARDSEQGVTVGGGLHLKWVNLPALYVDYAYQTFGVWDNVQMFTLGLEF